MARGTCLVQVKPFRETGTADLSKCGRSMYLPESVGVPRAQSRLPLRPSSGTFQKSEIVRLRLPWPCCLGGVPHRTSLYWLGPAVTEGDEELRKSTGTVSRSLESHTDFPE